MVKVLSKEPDPSVVKECICRECGAKLSYVPIDVQWGVDSDMDRRAWIVCPNCGNNVVVRT